MSKKILILDDDVIIRKSLRNILELEGFEVHETWTCQDSLNKCKEMKFDLLFLDYNLFSNEKGWNISKDVHNSDIYGNPKIIGMSATLEFKSREAIQFMEEGYIDVFLEKPFDFNILKSQLKRLLG